MGLAITKTDFSTQDYALFSQRLSENLDTLAQLLSTPGFGGQVRSMGAEVELYIIDEHAKPAPINEQLLAAAQNKQLTLELNQYNMEYNFRPTLCDAAPFSTLEQQWCEALDTLTSCASQPELPVTLPDYFHTNISVEGAKRFSAPRLLSYQYFCGGR